MRTVLDFVHKNSNAFGSRVKDGGNDPDRCQFSVSTHERWSNWNQCDRKIAEMVDGVGFCKQHAEKVKYALGYAEGDKVVFAAQFYQGEPQLSKIYYSSQTESMITIIKHESLIGNMFIMSGKQKKHTQYFQCDFFSSKKDAVDYLYQQSQEYLASATERVESARSTVYQLGELVRAMESK